MKGGVNYILNTHIPGFDLSDEDIEILHFALDLFIKSTLDVISFDLKLDYNITAISAIQKFDGRHGYFEDDDCFIMHLSLHHLGKLINEGPVGKYTLNTPHQYGYKIDRLWLALDAYLSSIDYWD